MAAATSYRIDAAPCVMRKAGGFVRRSDVVDVAYAVVRSIRLIDGPVALYVYPDRHVEIVAVERDDGGVLEYVDRAPLALVGIYDEDAEASDIVDDICAMRRDAEGTL